MIKLIGFLNINKPSGMSSAQVVARVKRLCPKGTKVGHLGTLDPMASGVLPIAIGRATRLFDMMQNKKKYYIATFQFGYTTDTLDTTGEIIATTAVVPTKKQIIDALQGFVGEIEQLPPDYSAKNVNGVRAYDLARKGKSFELKPCKVHIYDICLLGTFSDNIYEFGIECGSGTYIRSICRDLANKLGSLAVMTKLVRTQTGKFHLDNSQDCDNINLDNIITIPDALDNAQKYIFTPIELKILLDGKKLTKQLDDGTYIGYCNGEIQLIFESKNNIICNKIWLR